MFLESILLLAITTLTSSQLIESRCSRPAFSKVIGKQTHLSCAERSFFKSAREISQMAHEMGTLTIRRDWLGVNHQVTGRAFGTERHKRSTPSFLGCSTEVDYITYGRWQYIIDNGSLYMLCYIPNLTYPLFQPIMIVSCGSQTCCNNVGRCVLVKKPVTLCVYLPDGQMAFRQFYIGAICQCKNLGG